MKKLLFILLLFFGLNANSQTCILNHNGWIIPAGPYRPGDIVVVGYTLYNWNQLNLNWVKAFQINLGPGWSNLQPLITPVNASTQTGYWLWDIQHTFPSGLNFGPGWRFINTGIFPEWGSSSTGPFHMRFQLTVGPTCTPDNLSISMNVFGDCLTGGWNNGVCCSDPAYNIYNGNVQIIPIITSNINHY